MDDLAVEPPDQPATAPSDRTATDRGPDDSSPWPTVRRELGAYAELLALWGITVAQPVLDSFRGSPDRFVFRRAETTDIVLFALGITFLVPAVLFLLEWLVGLSSGAARRVVHIVLVTALFALAGWQLVERHADTGWLGHTVSAVVAAVVGGTLVWRFAGARTILRVVAIVPAAVALTFLFTDPIHQIAFAEGPGTASGAPIDRPVPIVMLLLDEFPTASILDEQGHVDATLFPNFARLAGDSTWYRNHSTVSPTTPKAVPAILTGNYPTEEDVEPVAASHPENLFSVLEGAYDLNVWEISTQLCPPEQCPASGGAQHQGLWPLLDDAWSLWLDYLDAPPPTDEEAFAIRQSDPSAPDRFARFLDSIEGDGSEPRVDFLHLLFPHQPWRHLPDGHRHDGPFLAEGLGNPNYSWQSEFFTDAARQRHLLQLQRADALLGDLLDRLEELGRYDESLIVVTADHGVAFEVGSPIRGAGSATVEEIAWTPLFVKEPGQSTGRLDDRGLETVDILPTIAEIIGLELPWKVDGTSAYAERDEGDDRRRFYPWERNELEPVEGWDHIVVDGTEAFARLFEIEPAGSEPRDDLQVYRFGRWGHLVGMPADELATTDQLAGTGVTFIDKDDEPVDPARYGEVDLDDEILPVYVRGELDTALSGDVLVTVNGTIGGWSEVFTDDGQRRFFVLVPPQLLVAGHNEIEVFLVDKGEDGEPLLTPLAVTEPGS